MTASSTQFPTLAAAAEAYARWIARSGKAESTVTSYTDKVTRFAAWADERAPRYDGVLSDTDVRDYAARDYRREALTVHKLAPATVATIMAALGSFFEWVGIGRPAGVSVDVPRAGKVGITDEDTLRAVLRAAKRRGPRDYAIVTLMVYAGPRLGEVCALDVDDVFVNGRVGQVAVRYGKGGKPRPLTLSPAAREAMATWLSARRAQANTAGEAALFVSRTGERLAHRTVQAMIADLGAKAGVRLTPHLLRHTYGRRFIESGGDVVALQETMGHRHLSTTAIYAKPSAEYIEAQIARLDVPL